MKLTERTLKKMIVEMIESNKDLFRGQFRATAPTLGDPDPLDGIFKFIDVVGDAALKQMGKTFDDLAPGDDMEYSELTNKIVYEKAREIKKASPGSKLSNHELLDLLEGFMPMLVDAVVADKRVEALFLK